MTYSVLLYGATGYSGRLIAAEAKARDMAKAQTPREFRMILAARDGKRLREVAEEICMDYRVFALDDRAEIRSGLDGIDVLINAAGPFARTAEPLAKAALQAGCHYVDINGEVDVYMKLDDLGWRAARRNLAMVCGAGNTAAASDLLLDSALRGLARDKNELGTVRIAVSRVMDFSRGSAETVSRSLREQVIVVRKGHARDKPVDELVIWHEPVGKLERMFHLGRRGGDNHNADRQGGDNADGDDRRIASAANLVDTLTARLTVVRNRFAVHGIESYVETGPVSRAAYQLGAMLASFSAIPWMRALTQAQLSLLPEGPTQEELKRQRHVVVLEIEDAYRTRKIDWQWETPNVYQFTAQLVVEVARQVAATQENGWMTPAQALRSLDLVKVDDSGPLRGCVLKQRPC